MSKFVLALDLGTTGNRAILFDPEGRAVAEAYQEFTQHFPRPGWVEHDPQEIWESTLSCIRAAASQVAAGDIACIGITNQRETTILWDRLDGTPVYPAIVWQDLRTAGRCESLKAVHGQAVHHRTGLLIDPYFSATKIRWILEQVPGVAELARQGRILFGTVDAWVLWKLTAGRVHATDVSNASRTLLLDVRQGTWDEELIEVFGTGGVVLPQVRPSLGPFGAADESVLGREIPVTAVLGDQQASLFAQCGSSTQRVKNTYGTGLFLMMCTGEELPLCEELLTTVAWSRAGGALEYALEGSILFGGASVQWLRDGLGILNSSGDSEQLAARLADNEGVYFVPALAGLGAPYWDRSAGGLLIGLTRGTRREHLARAALESMAFQTRDVVEAMQRRTGRLVSSLAADGKPALNDWLMQFQADILGIPVERSATAEVTAWGIAQAAGRVAGLWDERQRPPAVTIERVFEPRMSTDRRESLYTSWLRAVDRSRHWQIAGA